MNTSLPRTLIPLFFMILCLRTFQVHSQGYIIEHYTNENGLPANSVVGVEIDRRSGFVWIGTQAGLVRFDGKNFMRFGAARTPAPSSRIAAITKGREGAIYCEDDHFSMYRVEANRPVYVLTDSFFTAPIQARGGKFAIRPVSQLVEKLRRHVPSSFLFPWAVYGGEPDNSRSFSFIYFNHAYHYNAERDTLLDFPDFEEVVEVDKHVYFVRENLELCEYGDSLQKIQPVAVAGMPAWDKNGKERPRLLWTPGMREPLLTYGQDIWRLQRHGHAVTLQLLCSKCCPPNADIKSAQTWEEEGMIFLGSQVNGLYVLKTPFMHSVRADTTIEAGTVEYSQVEVAPGIINTSSGFSFSSTGKLLPGKVLLKFPYSDIYQDHNGDCWFSSGDTIVHFYRNSGHRTKIPLQDGSFKIIFGETRGRQYFISDRAIGEVTGDRLRPIYRLPSSAITQNKSLEPTDVIEWKPGILAIATGKLTLFDTEKGTLDTLLIPGLTDKVRALFKYGDYLLIGTYGQGFYMYKGGVVKKMPVDKYGYLAYAHCFLPDDKGFCWISTDHGLFKASLRALVQAYENDLDEIYYQYFGKEDGIFNTEFNGGCQPCALKLSNGLFSFPTMNGVVVFDPQQRHSPPPQQHIFIDEVRVDSIFCQADDSRLQELPYGSRNLRFRLAIPQFTNPENVYFSYKLDPYNERWETQDITQNGTLQFGGLKPGDYTLRLRIRNGFEPDQYAMTIVRFRILKPWYQTWWFYLAGLLCFMVFTGSLVKWRTARIANRKKELQQLVTDQTRDIEAQSRQLERQLHQLESQQARLEEDNRIKARLIGIISHDMVSPIKFIGYMSKKLKSAFPSSDSHHHTAGFIANVARELEILSVNILNWIKFHHESFKMKPERFNLRQLVTASVEIAVTLSKEKGITFYNEVAEDLEVFQHRQTVSVIIYNLSMNAVKYTERGEIRVSSKQAGDVLSLSVSDTGAGMSPDLVKKLNSIEPYAAGFSIGETSRYQFGYVIIKDLLRLINGDLIIESVLNEGTKATIRLDLQDSKIAWSAKN